MYIGAKTEDGDVWVWTGAGWSDDPTDAEQYGEFAGSWELGKLDVEYRGRLYNGIRIESVFKIS